jgi:adenylate cyclase
MTGPEAAAAAGIDIDYARRIFRALGLPEVGDDVVDFDDGDVEVLKNLNTILQQGYSDEEILEVARTYGYAMSRVAQAEVRLFHKTFLEPLRDQGVDEEQLHARLDKTVPALLDVLGQQLDNVHRRHLRIALQQVTAVRAESASETLATGFVDLVDFSRLSQGLENDLLGELVSRFETLSLETCVAHGVHVVKMLGDAVMFVSADASAAVAAAMEIVEAVEADGELSGARAGLDIGTVVPVGGDFFGQAVNVAARLTSFARAGTVVVSDGIMDALGEGPDATRIGKVRLKGVGGIKAFKMNGL